MLRIAVLDDYQNVALEVADWSPLDGRAKVTSFHERFADEDETAAALQEFDCVVAMRERTPFPASLLARLPELRLLVTAGMRNAAIDLHSAAERGIVVTGTSTYAPATVELTWTLILAASRHVVEEAGNMASDGWQTTLGTALAGKTLGIVGLGKLGSAVAGIGAAFGMRVVAWSENLTAERAEAAGAELVSFDELLGQAHVVTIHTVLSDRTRGLIGTRELALMRPDALLVNTSRGPIVSTDALVEAVSSGIIGGAALDVYDEEPLPPGHPLRSTPGILATPHLGYVTRDTYEIVYGQAVEDIVRFLDDDPVRVLTT